MRTHKGENMKWELRKTYSKNIDGYDGLEYCKYDAGKIQKVIFTTSFKDACESYDVFTKKHQFYSTLEDKTPKIINRIAKLAENINNYGELIDVMKEKMEEDDE